MCKTKHQLSEVADTKGFECQQVKEAVSGSQSYL